MANALTLNGNGRCRSASAIDLSSATSLISIEIEGNFPKDIGNNQPLVAQWEGDQSSDNNFIFRVETVGELRTSISTNGNHVTGNIFDSTEPLPRPVNAIKVEIDLASQIIRYYYGDTVGGTYTQLGNDVTGTGITSLRSSSLLWDIGYTHNVAPAWTTTGSVKRVRVIADAVTVIDIDFSTASEGDTTVAATTGPNWVLSETAAIWNVTDNLGLAKPRTGPGLMLPNGSSGDYASTPDTAVLDITGDIDIRGYVQPDSWKAGNQVIAAKRDTPSVQESWQFWINPEGRFGWAWWNSSQVLKVISGPILPDATGVRDGQLLALRVTLRVSDGRVQMFYGPTLAGPWTLIHEDSTAGATSIFSSTAPLEVGSQSIGTTELFTGTIYEIEAYSGIDGTLVANPDFTAQTPGASSFTDGTGLLWTINGNAAILGDIIARLWADDVVGSTIGDIWDYNQTVLEKFIGNRDWQTFDPTPTVWSSLGTGTATGQFIVLPGDVIMAFGRATLGSGGSITTGTLRVPLPVNVDYEFLVQGDIVGQAQAFDASSTGGRQTGACYLMDDNTIRFVNESAVGAQFWTGTTLPFFWTVSDSLAFNVIYKGVPS